MYMSKIHSIEEVISNKIVTKKLTSSDTIIHIELFGSCILIKINFQYNHKNAYKNTKKMWGEEFLWVF